MKLAVAVTLLLVYLAVAAYYIRGAYQIAAFSIALSEPTRAAYQGRAVLALVLAGVSAVLGIVLFFMIKRPERDRI